MIRTRTKFPALFDAVFDLDEVALDDRGSGGWIRQAARQQFDLVFVPDANRDGLRAV